MDFTWRVFAHRPLYHSQFSFSFISDWFILMNSKNVFKSLLFPLRKKNPFEITLHAKKILKKHFPRQRKCEKIYQSFLLSHQSLSRKFHKCIFGYWSSYKVHTSLSQHRDFELKKKFKQKII